MSVELHFTVSSFWRRLLELGSSCPEVLKSIVGDAASRLRFVDLATRGAINATVSTVALGRKALPAAHLASTFPNARHLRLNCEEFHQEVELCLFLQLLASSCADFLPTVQKVTCHLPECAAGRFAAAAFARLVSGCSSLVALDVVYCSANTLAFQGQGVGPSEQRSSLQQQLALFTASPVLLTPASWPSQRCLTQLTITSTDRRPIGVHTSSSSSLVADMVHAAVHTPSLRHLSLAEPLEEGQAAALFSSLSALSALTNLTHLSCPQATTDGPLAAAAHLRALRSLHITAHPSSDILLPFRTARLAALTELQLLCPGASVDLQQLYPLTSLHALVVRHTACHGHMSSIFSLSQLTKLVLPRLGAAAVRSEVGGVQQAAGEFTCVEVPAEWRLGLQSLSWHEPAGAVLLQLTGLTQAWLQEAAVSPELCWALSQLPKLSTLRIKDGRIPARLPERPPHELRPLLPSLRTLHVQSHNTADVLELLATWTRVPGGCSLLPPAASSPKLTLAIGGWSPSWLQMVLECDQEVHVHLDRDADALLLAQDPAASRRAGGGGMLLSFGKHVGPAAIRGLLAAWVSPTLTVLQTTLGALSAAQIVALGAPHLRRLDLGDISYIEDAGVVALAELATGLEALSLTNAVRLTDVPLWAICKHCRLLRRLLLAGMKQATAAGVLPLLMTSGSLLRLAVSCVITTDTGDLHRQLEMSLPPDTGWQLARQGWFLVCTRAGAAG